MEPTIPIPNNKILVVEFDDRIRDAIVTTLQIENYYVLQAKNTADAFSVLEKNTPDLILSDMSNPGMNGVEFFNKIRNDMRLSAIPFVFLTKPTFDHRHQTIRELGVEDWVTKPINPASLTRTINARLLRAAEVKIAHIDQAYLETVEVLANAVEGRDRYTRGHIERVTTYSLWLAEELRWPEENLRTLKFGARLHDIGKIIVPDQILNKAGNLSEKEWELMRQHPSAGAKMLQKISHLEDAIPYILYHHEKWNGQGYPAGLVGREIPLGARILAISDVFDALTTPRPYRSAQPRETAYKYIISESGKHFDPDLVPTFITIIREHSITKQSYKHE
jgi:putative two-component system response regulator